MPAGGPRASSPRDLQRQPFGCVIHNQHVLTGTAARRRLRSTAAAVGDATAGGGSILGGCCILPHIHCRGGAAQSRVWERLALLSRRRLTLHWQLANLTQMK